jgi:hypothetical protein
MRHSPSKQLRQVSLVKCVRALLVAAALLTLWPATGAAQEFTAEVVFTPVIKIAGGTGKRAAVPTVPSAKLYVTEQQLRFESHGVTGQTLLVDSVEHTTVALFPKDKTYQPLASAPREYFRVSDPERACADWQRAVGKKIDCAKVADEVLDGRRSVKYRRHGDGGSVEYVWIDRQLKFVLKWRTDQTEAQLRDIQEGPQSPELFTVPQDYHAVTPKKPRTSPRTS